MKTAILFLVLIFLIDLAIGFPFRMWRFPLFDASLHFFGGFFIAMFFYNYLKDSIKTRFLKIALIIVGVTVFIGMMWEFTEYSATRLFGNYLYDKYQIICCIGNMDDTFNDLAMDIVGAITFVLAFLNPSKSRTRQE